MTQIIEDRNFTKVADSVKPDSKHRVGLAKAHIPDGVTYHVYRNAIGQIVLDPQVTIPASELWLFQDKEALASVHRDGGQAEPYIHSSGSSLNGSAPSSTSIAWSQESPVGIASR